MKTVVISEFKAKCIAILKEVNQSGDQVIVTLRGKPLVQIEPIPKESAGCKLGALRGQVRILGDIVHCDFSDDWEMLKE